MLKTGMIIAERYEILAKIGTGGMADVYRARDHKLNRLVAVKVLKQEFREDKTFIHKFRSEAQAAAGLTHTNIVNVFDVGDDAGIYYIVMELIEGITLKEYITKKGRLSIKEATSIAIQVSMGLEAAHSHGVVHRDVKPQNIIISTDGKVKVTDFGIARAASSNTISSNVMGSVHYSSPEQVRGGYSDEKSDIYSLGITIYEMVTGRVPFEGDTTVAIAIKHLQEEMVPPSAYAPELPFSLEQIIFKCTQKSVDRRYQKMEEVIADLKHSLIDPQGDFVKMTADPSSAKTVVISDQELGQIKQTSKQNLKEEVEELEKELRAENQEDDEAAFEEEERKERQEKKRKRKKRRTISRAVTITGSIIGALVLILAIFFIGRAAGIITFDSDEVPETVENTETQETEEEAPLLTPDLVGKTESDAKEIAQALHLGIQLMGEETSTQAKGVISSQSPAAGTEVEEYSTIQYYVSTGSANTTMPNVSDMTAIEAQRTLEDMGMNVSVEKEYSELNEEDYAVYDPGYVMYTVPSYGDTISVGDTITLVVSRGKDWGNSATVPNVIGMMEDDALTTLGKWIDIQVTYEQNSEIEAGEVISQSIEADTNADPDEPIGITVSSGNQSPEAMQQSTDGVSEGATVEEVSAASGETWYCNQRLNTPTGYQGGAIRLELVQTVSGVASTTTVLEGEVLEFPYQLNIIGISGVSDGTLYISELVDGSYVQLGHYPLTFNKLEQ